MRNSELLGLIWADIDFATRAIHVRGQLSRAHRAAPARRIPPKTSAAIRDIPLVPQLAGVLREHRRSSRFTSPRDWVSSTSRGTPIAHRNAQRRAFARAARIAGRESGEWPALRFHD